MQVLVSVCTHSSIIIVINNRVLIDISLTTQPTKPSQASIMDEMKEKFAIVSEFNILDPDHSQKPVNLTDITNVINAPRPYDQSGVIHWGGDPLGVHLT